MNDAWRSKAPASADASNAWKKNTNREIGMSLDSASITDARERAHEDYQNYISINQSISRYTFRQRI
jgi:hypothetical protein